uniref:Uncharacterized protein n=1 Tax=Sphaerodactylus townsendi TaxID=933632 RepID=A0ACB8E6E1_9SAUR
MECVGSAAVLDLAEGAARLPGGFWAAVGVWLEKPQVANKRLSGAHLEESRAMPRPRSSPAGAGPGGGGPRAASSELDVAWQALRCSSLGPLLLGPGPAHVDALLRTLLPKGRPAPARELVVRDVFNGTVTFLPLEQNHEGKFKIKECNIYQIKLLHRKVNEWSLSVLSPSPENYVSDGIVYPKTTWLGNELLAKLAKWSLETKKCEFKNTLSLISLARYNNSYQNLKEKYKEIVKVWPEVTDPQKFVYEDVAIAAYLLILWEDERAAKGMSSKQSFVDLGCGNGLLVHILSSEGHPGKGVDVRRRKIWDMYGPQTHLESVDPDRRNWVHSTGTYPRTVESRVEWHQSHVWSAPPVSGVVEEGTASDTSGEADPWTQERREYKARFREMQQEMEWLQTWAQNAEVQLTALTNAPARNAPEGGGAAILAFIQGLIGGPLSEVPNPMMEQRLSMLLTVEKEEAWNTFCSSFGRADSTTP